MQFYLAYVMGVPGKAGKSASMGNVIHKAAETLAWVSYHRARGNAEYKDETFGRLVVDDVTPEWAVDAAYAHYKVVDDHVKWNDRYDLPTCREWMDNLLALSDGYFDPRNQDVVQAEQRFDLVIEKPWARYRFDTPGGVLEGHLSIKGTMDLIVRDKHDPGVLEVIDYKTGKRKDWGEPDEAKSEKTWKKLMHDPQLLLYYYATNRLYPDADHIIFTIVYINHGGPFRMAFGPEHMDEAEAMLERKYRTILDTRIPPLKVGKPCWTFCAYGKNSKGKMFADETICQHYAAEVRKKGADPLFYEIGNINKLTNYQDGGGRKADGA